MLRLNLALNSYAFHWSFPEIVADSEGLFADRGVDVAWRDVTPKGVVSKTALYTDLLKEKQTDVYHAAEWACISRVLKSDDAWIVAKSAPGEGTLNSTFSLYVRPDSRVTGPEGLGGKSVAIELGTGAQYTTILDLERHLDVARVKLVQTGEPHRRLEALIRGEVDAASMVGPWADIARAMGMRMLMRTRRSNPTTLVVRKDEGEPLVRGFFGAVNEAIRRIDEAPQRFLELYLARVKWILSQMDLKVADEALAREVEVSKWGRWEGYNKDDFRRAYEWMVERGLAEPGRGPEGLVGDYSSGIFS
jgi:hypothetical protein